MNAKPYLIVSGLLFALVSIGHLTRALSGWPVWVDGWAVPIAVSWLGAVVPAALCLWAWRLAAD